MINFMLFYEFFKIGLFAIGGGLATIPFLYNLADKTNCFIYSEISNMIAISESTPGPLGINMATYVGYTTGSFIGKPASERTWLSSRFNKYPFLSSLNLPSLVIWTPSGVWIWK